MRARALIAVAAVLLAGAVAGVMASIAIQHNPQEEYCIHIAGGECAIQWGPVFLIAVSWFVPVLLLVVVALAVAWLLKKGVRGMMLRLARRRTL